MHSQGKEELFLGGRVPILQYSAHCKDLAIFSFPGKSFSNWVLGLFYFAFWAEQTYLESWAAGWEWGSPLLLFWAWWCHRKREKNVFWGGLRPYLFTKRKKCARSDQSTSRKKAPVSWQIFFDRARSPLNQKQKKQMKPSPFQKSRFSRF